ncbi:MAG: hypothetical protein V1849_02070, partial [Chloroflexota bacterium]
RPEVSPDQNVVLVLQESEVVIPLASMVDREAERTRMLTEVAELQTQVSRLEERLKDEAFLTKAPPAVVEKERTKLASAQDRLARLKDQVARFGG